MQIKKILISFSIIVAITLFIFISIDKKDKNNYYDKISGFEKNKENYNIIQKDIYGYTSESGQKQIYLDDSQRNVLMTISNHYAESGKKSIYVVYSDNKPKFAVMYLYSYLPGSDLGDIKNEKIDKFEFFFTRKKVKFYKNGLLQSNSEESQDYIKEIKFEISFL